MTQNFDEADRPVLLASLEYQRASVRSIVDGMSEEHWPPFVIDWPSDKVLAHYRDRTRLTDDMLATTALDSAPLCRHDGTDTDQPRTVREIVLHILEETAAHSGHLEIARELLDGSTRRGLR